MTTLVALARHLPDPVRAPLRPAWRWLRRVRQWWSPDGIHRADGRVLLVNYRLTEGRHKVRTVWDEMDELDPWLLYHLEKRDD